MNDREYEVIGHSLGIKTRERLKSEMEKDKYLPEDFYRNYFCCGSKEHPDFIVLELLQNKGFAVRCQWHESIYFIISEKGIRAFRDEFTSRVTTTYKRPSKDRQKYLDYLEADTCTTFAQWLGIEVPTREYNQWRQVRLTSSKATGQYFTLLKDAKASYKEVLKRNHRPSKQAAS